MILQWPHHAFVSWREFREVTEILTSFGVSAYSFTLSTDTMLFSTSVQDLTIQLKIAVTCKIWQTYNIPHASSHTLPIDHIWRSQNSSVSEVIKSLNEMERRTRSFFYLKRVGHGETHDARTQRVLPHYRKDCGSKNHNIAKELKIYSQPPIGMMWTGYNPQRLWST